MKVMIKTAILAALLPFVVACNNESAGNATSTDSAAAKDAEHVHTYACPMHPEVTGKEGDECPKCGMKLEHMDEKATANVGHFMEVKMNPTTVEPNKEVQLSFTPRIKGREAESVALDVEHEKKIHLILVSDDLSWFDHIHPEYQADGAYTVPAKFPAPGKYKAFADYKPTGGRHVVDKVDVDVVGNAPAAKKFTADKWSGNSGAYSFQLTPTGGKFYTGSAMHIQGVVMKDGKEIDAATLDNYLGAKAHVVVISLNEKEYLHVHPSVEEGKFDLHTTFDRPGIYRGWVQFNADGKIHTIDFTMNVAQGTAQDAKNAEQGHGTSGTDHSSH